MPTVWLYCSGVKDEIPIFNNLQGYAYISKLLSSFWVVGKQRVKRCLFRKEPSNGFHWNRFTNWYLTIDPPKHMKGKTDSSTIKVVEINTPLLIINRITIQNINKETEDLSNTTSQLNLTNFTQQHHNTHFSLGLV